MKFFVRVLLILFVVVSMCFGTAALSWADQSGRPAPTPKQLKAELAKLQAGDMVFVEGVPQIVVAVKNGVAMAGPIVPEPGDSPRALSADMFLKDGLKVIKRDDGLGREQAIHDYVLRLVSELSQGTKK